MVLLSVQLCRKSGEQEIGGKCQESDTMTKSVSVCNEGDHFVLIGGFSHLGTHFHWKEKGKGFLFSITW